MINQPSLGIDVGSTGCRFAVIHDGAPLPLWVPRQFDDGIADAASLASAGSDVAGDSLGWKDALGETKPGSPFGEEFVSGLFRRGLAAATSVLGAKPRRSVLCVPAYYTARQRQLLHQCAFAAGLDEAFLVGDTLALAMAHAERQPTGQFLVYHVGQMRLEIGVVSVLAHRFNVLSYRSQDTLSGRSLARLLLGSLSLAIPPTRAREFSALSVAALRRVLQEVGLRFTQRETVAVQLLSPDGTVEVVKATRHEWFRRMEPLIVASMRDVDTALNEARLQTTHLTQVLLAGGSTVWPCFQEILAAHVSQPVQRLHDWSPAFGAARLAASLTPRELADASDWAPEPPSVPEERDKPVVVNLNLPHLDGRADSARTDRNAAPSGVPPRNPPSAPSVGHRLAQRALEEARKLLAHHQLQGAVAMSHQACQDDEKDPEIFAAMLDIHCQAAIANDTPDGYIKALEWLHCANGHAPGNTAIRQALAERHLLHARQMMKCGRVREASQAVQLAFELRPECPETERLLLEIQSLSGNEGR